MSEREASEDKLGKGKGTRHPPSREPPSHKATDEPWATAWQADFRHPQSPQISLDRISPIFGDPSGYGFGLADRESKKPGKGKGSPPAFARGYGVAGRFSEPQLYVDCFRRSPPLPARLFRPCRGCPAAPFPPISERARGDIAKGLVSNVLSAILRDTDDGRANSRRSPSTSE